MAFNISSVGNFLANFPHGGARPNRYQIVLTFPAALPGAMAASRKISFTCKAASIPSSNMGVCDVPYMGRQVKVAGDKVWDDWNVTIIVDGDFLGRDIFEQWHNMMNGFDSNAASPAMLNPPNYYAQAIVNQLDRADRIIKTYNVQSMFPIQVAEVALGYDVNDQVMEQQVTFAINGWNSNTTMVQFG